MAEAAQPGGRGTQEANILRLPWFESTGGSGEDMTKLMTVPKFAKATGLSYRHSLQLVETGQIPSVPVGRRRRIDTRWVEQWLASGGYRWPESKLASGTESDPRR